MPNRVYFAYGTKAQFTSTDPKDANTVYFITDYQEIYKGGTLISDATKLNVQFTTSLPESDTSEEGILYVATVDGKSTLWIKSASTMIQVGGGEATEIADGVITFTKFAEGLVATDLASPNDTTIPTTKAVSDAITSALSDYNGTFKDVSASRAEDNSGTVLTFTPVSGETKTVTISDLFLTSASYDNESHILSFTVKGSEDPVTVNLEDLVPQAVNASQVAMAREITVTTTVGNLKAGDKVIITGDPQSGEVKAADVQAMFEAILSKDINPTTTQPSASITLTGAGEKEVGTSFTPSYTANLNAGKYSVAGQGDQASGVTATSYSITDTLDNSSDTQTGQFDSFIVEDDTDYYVSATINYGDGNIPKTFLGNSYPDGQIKAGSKSATSTHVKGYRNCWWGYKTSSNLIGTPANITADQIKTLGNSNKNRPTTLSTNQMQQMFFAIPAGQVTSLSIQASTGLPQTVQGPVTVQVGGVDNYSPTNYDVFYVSNAAAEAGTETFTLTWK